MIKYIFLFLVLFLPYGTAYGQSIDLFSSKQVFDIGEEFYVDINIDTKGKNINGFESQIVFNENNVKFIRFDSSKSILTHFINSKIQNPGVFEIAGIVPNGFTSFLNTSESNTGNIGRIYFLPVSSGDTLVSLREVYITENDGLGTVMNLNNISQTLSVTNKVIDKRIEIQDFRGPALEAEIVREDNLYNKELTLVFNAIDKDSGVEGVYIKNKKTWIKIENPHKLEELGSSGILSIKAIDFAGNETVKRFFLPGYKSGVGYLITLATIIAFILGSIFYKKNVKNKIFKIK